MQRTAKIFMNNRSQAVRLPKEFQFAVSEVFIRKQGDEVILSARPRSWFILHYLANLLKKLIHDPASIEFAGHASQP